MAPDREEPVLKGPFSPYCVKALDKTKEFSVASFCIGKILLRQNCYASRKTGFFLAAGQNKRPIIVVLPT